MKLLEAKCLERMASVHLATDDPGLAMSLYYQSLFLFKKCKDQQGIAKVYNIIGCYQTETGSFDSAESCLRKAMAINIMLKDEFNLSENKRKPWPFI